MRCISTLRHVVVVALAGLAACSGDPSSEPVTATLFADPEACDVPCEVVLDSGVEAEGRAITFTWDFGDGPVDGQERMRHRFETAGTYEVSLTVGDGGQSSSDTIVVVAETQPSASARIGESGGSLSQGGATLSVPPDVAPQEVDIELTELPSMGEAATRVIDINRFSPLGNAYRVSTPMKTSTALDIAVRVPEASGKRADELAWLVRRVGRPVLPETETPSLSRAPIVDYVLWPVTRVDEDGTAHGDIFGRQRMQLVELSEPLEVRALEAPSAPASESSAISAKAAPPPSTYVIFWDDPAMGLNAFEDAVKEGIDNSYNVLVAGMGFVGPQGTITVAVGSHPKPGWLGAVAHDDNQTIRLSHVMKTQEQVMKVVAHEYFHLIQNLNNNETSILGYWDEDIWFLEGSADWACDEVFDSIPGHYHPTRWLRFETRLNQSGAKESREYETVGFWKWAESYREGTVRKIVENKYLLTHTTEPGSRTMVENSEAVNNLEVLLAVWPRLDFLSYVYDARYEKDFELDEQGDNELWGKSPYLGKQKEVYLRDSKDDSVAKELPGDGESNPLKMSYTLKEELTAEVFRIGNLDLEGNLRIRFSKTPLAPLDAQVLMLDSKTGELFEEQTLRDLSKAHSDVRMSFEPGKEAVIFVVDGRWEYTDVPIPTSGEILAWVEDPCGALPSNVIDVTPDDDLFATLSSAPEGSAVRLGPGTYYPPLKDWPTPEYGPFGANVLVKELTLVGSGEGQTRIVMSGNEYGGIGLKTYGNATLRNFTIEARQAEPAIDCLDAKHVTMCNVTVEASSTTDYGLLWGPWNGGSTSLSLHDCTFIHPNREHLGTAIQLQSCYDPPASVSADLSLTRVSGWGVGVSFDNGASGCGPISVNADCDGFSNNDYNVLESVCSGGSCDFTEHCPNPTP